MQQQMMERLMYIGADDGWCGFRAVAAYMKFILQNECLRAGLLLKIRSWDLPNHIVSFWAGGAVCNVLTEKATGFKEVLWATRKCGVVNLTKALDGSDGSWPTLTALPREFDIPGLDLETVQSFQQKENLLKTLEECYGTNGSTWDETMGQPPYGENGRMPEEQLYKLLNLPADMWTSRLSLVATGVLLSCHVFCKPFYCMDSVSFCSTSRWAKRQGPGERELVYLHPNPKNPPLELWHMNVWKAADSEGNELPAEQQHWEGDHWNLSKACQPLPPLPLPPLPSSIPCGVSVFRGQTQVGAHRVLNLVPGLSVVVGAFSPEQLGKHAGAIEGMGKKAITKAKNQHAGKLFGQKDGHRLLQEARMNVQREQAFKEDFDKLLGSLGLVECLKFYNVVAVPDCMWQHTHTDYSIASYLSEHETDIDFPYGGNRTNDLSALIMLHADGNIHIPGGIKVENNAGDMFVFDRNFLHGGGKYTTQNSRGFGYISKNPPDDREFTSELLTAEGQRYLARIAECNTEAFDYLQESGETDERWRLSKINPDELVGVIPVSVDEIEGMDETKDN
jgi:hypothetical protein